MVMYTEETDPQLNDPYDGQFKWVCLGIAFYLFANALLLIMDPQICSLAGRVAFTVDMVLMLLVVEILIMRFDCAAMARIGVVLGMLTCALLIWFMPQWTRYIYPKVLGGFLLAVAFGDSYLLDSMVGRIIVGVLAAVWIILSDMYLVWVARIFAGCLVLLGAFLVVLAVTDFVDRRKAGETGSDAV